MKKGVKIALIVVGSIVGLLLVALLLVSPVAKHYIEKHDKELIGREVSIGKLRVNPLYGAVQIRDFTLYEDDGATPFVSFGCFKTSVKLRELLNHRLWVRRVLLSGLNVHVEQDRTWFNFNSMVDHFATDTPKREKKESSPFGLVFNNINIEKSYIRYSDLDIGSEFNLHSIDIRIPYIDLSDMKTHVGLDLCLADSATLHTDLHLSENADSYFVNLQLKDLGIDIIEPYLKQSLAVDSLKGKLSLDFEAEGKTEHILDFDLTGNMLLSDLSLRDTLGTRLGHVDSIFAKIGRFNLNENVLNFQNFTLSGFSTAYIIHPDNSSNFDLFLGRKQHSDTTIFEKAIDTIAAEIERVQQKKSLKINIDELRLANNRIHFEDRSLPDTFRYEITDFGMVSEHFNLNGTNTARMQGRLNQMGHMYVNWQGDVHSLNNQDLTLMLSNIKLADFSPYVLRLFGYPLENGTLSFRSQNIVKNGNLEGINQLQIASPKVGDKQKNITPQVPHIPLKLGVYLLTDRNNNFSADLPVSGNINDPEFSYFKTLLKVFGNLMVKVATAPFRLLAGDGETQYIPFDLLQPDFSADQYALIDGVINMLGEKPELGLVWEARINVQQTVQELCNLQLQRDYYLSLHPEMEAKSIDFLTNETIRSIKLNDKGLCDYAAQYSEKEQLRSKQDVASVAYEVYHQRSEQMLPGLIERRNARLAHYLKTIKGLSPEQSSVSTLDPSLWDSYNKPTRYELHVSIYGDE